MATDPPTVILEASTSSFNSTSTTSVKTTAFDGDQGEEDKRLRETAQRNKDLMKTIRPCYISLKRLTPKNIRAKTPDKGKRGLNKGEDSTFGCRASAKARKMKRDSGGKRLNAPRSASRSKKSSLDTEDQRLESPTPRKKLKTRVVKSSDRVPPSHGPGAGGATGDAGAAGVIQIKKTGRPKVPKRLETLQHAERVREFYKLVTDGDHSSTNVRCNHFAQLDPMARQTGIVTHRSYSEPPFKLVGIKRGKTTEELAFELLEVVKAQTTPLEPLMPPPAKSQAIDMPILWQPRDHDSAQVDTNSSSTSSSKETSRMDKTHCSHNRPSGQDRRRSHSRSSRQDRSRSYNRPSGKGRNRYRNLPDDKDQTSRESSPASSASSKQSVLLGSSSQMNRSLASLSQDDLTEGPAVTSTPTRGRGKLVKKYKTGETDFDRVLGKQDTMKSFKIPKKHKKESGYFSNSQKGAAEERIHHRQVANAGLERSLHNPGGSTEASVKTPSCSSPPLGPDSFEEPSTETIQAAELKNDVKVRNASCSQKKKISVAEYKHKFRKTEKTKNSAMDLEEGELVDSDDDVSIVNIIPRSAKGGKKKSGRQRRKKFVISSGEEGDSSVRMLEVRETEVPFLQVVAGTPDLPTAKDTPEVEHPLGAEDVTAAKDTPDVEYPLAAEGRLAGEDVTAARDSPEVEYPLGAEDPPAGEDLPAGQDLPAGEDLPAAGDPLAVEDALQTDGQITIRPQADLTVGSTDRSVVNSLPAQGTEMDPTLTAEEEGDVIDLGLVSNDMIEDIDGEEFEPEQQSQREEKFHAPEVETEQLQEREPNEPQQDVYHMLPSLPSVDIATRCESLRHRRICFRKLEFGDCKRTKCMHMHDFAFEDIRNFFCVIRDSFPHLLPKEFQNRRDDRIHRLMSIYNSHKHQYLSKRSIFLPLYEDLLKQLLTAGPDKVSMAFLRILLEDLRACIATCMSEIDYPQIIGLVLLHVHILRNITSSSASPEDSEELCNVVWNVAYFTCDHYLVLPQKPCFFLPRENYEFLDKREGEGDEYSFLLEYLISHESNLSRVLFFISFLATLPSHTLHPQHLESVIRRATKDKQLCPQYLADFLLPTTMMVALEDLKMVPSGVLQQLINACYRFPDHRDSFATGLLYLSRIRDVVVDGAVGVASVITSESENEVENMASQMRWGDLVCVWREKVNEMRTRPHTISRMMVAIFEGMVANKKTPAAIDRNFTSFVEKLTSGWCQSLLPTEKSFLAQLAATLIVHIDGMDSEQRFSKLGDPFTILSVCKEKIFLPPWASNTIYSHDGIVAADTKMTAAFKVAIAAIRMLLRRKLGYAAALILLIDARDLFVTCPSDASFHICREILEVLLLDRESAITGGRLVHLISDLFVTFLARVADNPRDSSVSTLDKAHVHSVLFNRIVRMALHCQWGGTDGPLLRDRFLPFVRGQLKTALLDYSSTRGLVHLLSEEGCMEDARCVYDLGVINVVYREQDLETGVLYLCSDLTMNEMRVLVEEFLLNLYHDCMSPDEVLNMHGDLLSSGGDFSAVNASRLGCLKARLITPAEERMNSSGSANGAEVDGRRTTGLLFVDTVASAFGPALSRMHQAFQRIGIQLTNDEAVNHGSILVPASVLNYLVTIIKKHRRMLS